MKKSKSLRLASILLMLCLITTCAVSGTFAKYVTSGNAQDTARVAQWGVTIQVAAEDAFATKYDNEYNASATKVISVGGDVVAPGTNGTLATFTIAGDPEVAVNLNIAVTNIAGDANAKDIFVTSGDYKDWTTASDTDNYNLANDYHPIKYTLKKNGTPVSGCENVPLSTIETKLESLSSNFDAGATEWDDLTDTYVITWEWAFVGDDKTDTLLGNLAAGIETSIVDATKYSTVVDFKITITVTQID